MVKEELIKFEDLIANAFNKGEIKAPIHLYHGNEDSMIEIFKDIDIKNDWVCCTWRNHYQGLLKGIPSDVMEANIRKGKSMVANLPEYKFICSSIVEAYKYSLNYDFPITFIVEDNKKSVCTPTPDVWKRSTPYYLNTEYKGGILRQKNLIYYQYDNTKYPHAGAGVRVQF